MADLPDRDLSFAEGAIPLISWLVDHYFRVEVTGMDNIPGDRPVLFVANHSGGNGSPDSVAFILRYIQRFGIERPLYWLGHEVITSMPGLGSFLRRCGVLPASRGAAAAALRAGGSVVVYPGGDRELHRAWTARNQIRFYGRKGFVRLASEAGVPIVPVVSAGGHNTYLPLTDGGAIARRLGLDRRFRLKVLPISLALPWGINVGDFLLHIPLPAHIRIAVLPPVDVRERWGDDVDAAYEGITRLMQAALDGLV
jgi:1-acyl-sn-glycerol-3-phosphate acyltransferase